MSLRRFGRLGSRQRRRGSPLRGGAGGVTCAGLGGGRGASGGEGEHGVSGGARGARDGTPTAPGGPRQPRGEPARPSRYLRRSGRAARARCRLRAGPCERHRLRERRAGVGAVHPPRHSRAEPPRCVSPGVSFPAGEEGAAVKARKEGALPWRCEWGT